MKPLRPFQLWSLTVALALLTACASLKPHYASPVEFIAPMDKLASAVDAELHNPFTSEPPSGAQLLAAAMSQKPELQAAFRKVTVQITNYESQAVILLVSPTNRNVAWLEFATWSRPLAQYHYLSNHPSPARFSIPFP